jgi:hypothetical protein
MSSPTNVQRAYYLWWRSTMAAVRRCAVGRCVAKATSGGTREGVRRRDGRDLVGGEWRE